MNPILISEKMNAVEFLDHEFTEQELQEAWFELIDGQMRKRNYPTILHQETSMNILRKIDAFVFEKKLGKVFHPPTGVILGEYHVVLPDLVFVSQANVGIIQDTGIFGAPDLVVEIISPSTLKDDRNDKKDLYAQFNIQEYWIIDPHYASIELFEHTEKGYVLAGFAVESGKVVSKVLAGFEMEIQTVFA
ncbi:MAG: Uma2 family endonuclease [Microscillaceae bacterium]|nr:Uma2 family endonuclease [Microscillaceae bacterium]